MKNLVTTSIVWIAGLLLAGGLFAQSYSYPSDFVLPEDFPLHHVYIGIQEPAGHDGAMLPRELNGTLEPEGVRPPGFEVPVGTSSFDLVSVMEGHRPNPHASQWAVFGLYTDGDGTKHIVLGTNADLTGVELCSQELLGKGSLACGEDYIIEVLESGSLLGEGLGMAGAILNPMRENGLMLDWGERSQLFFFSEGQAIPGGSVEAIEIAPVPEPPLELEASQVWLSDNIELAWRDGSDNETGFRLQYLAYPTAPGNWQTLGQVDADVTLYRTDKTALGRRYAFRVAAFNEAGISAWSNQVEVVVSYWISPLLLLIPLVVLVAIVSWRLWIVRSRKRG